MIEQQGADNNQNYPHNFQPPHYLSLIPQTHKSAKIII